MGTTWLESRTIISCYFSLIFMVLWDTALKVVIEAISRVLPSEGTTPSSADTGTRKEIIRVYLKGGLARADHQGVTMKRVESSNIS
jgi:hypothetical protein